MRETYLGGFAGGSVWLLHSESERAVFLKVVIIRGGFGGPCSPLNLIVVAEFCCRIACPFCAMSTHRVSVVATLGCDNRLKSSSVCVLLGNCGFECCLCKSTLPGGVRPYASSWRRSFGWEVTSSWEWPVFEGCLFRKSF